jgi:ectoine hydroxylase-related dioxygenase (phytanoyl-CoA dioxygenase family)
VFVPLVDMRSVAVGPTEFTPGTHLQWRRRQHGSVAITAAAGDAIVFDYRLRHRGLPNKTADVVRPLVYVTYAKPFFKDEANFSLQRYTPLPPLVPIPSRKRKGEAEC